MTSLADLTAGDQFLFVASVESIDDAGFHLSLFGPAATAAGTAVIGPDGTMAGTLAMAASQVPVTVVTGLVPVSVGDVLESRQSGETAVCRWSQVTPDGTVTWASAAAHEVVYPASGWTIIGHVDL
jgi:hypothetical protein